MRLISRVATSKRKSKDSSWPPSTFRTAIHSPDRNFDYKLAWFERLISHAEALSKSGAPVVLAGDFNVVPTNVDIYNAWARTSHPRRLTFSIFGRRRGLFAGLQLLGTAGVCADLAITRFEPNKE
jgi:hypothetical protein